MQLYLYSTVVLSKHCRLKVFPDKFIVAPHKRLAGEVARYAINRNQRVSKLY